MKSLVILAMTFTAFIFVSCGKPGVDVTNASYEPKIAVEGYLYCGETVKGIKVMRNFPVGSKVDGSALSLTPSENGVTVSINGSLLTFDSQTHTYYNDQLTVDYGKTYTLAVSARIDGAQLQTTSTTTTPLPGFALQHHDLGDFKYGSTSLVLSFMPSPGTGFYAFSIVPDTAAVSNFIYSNGFAPNLDSADVAESLDQFRFSFDMLSDINPDRTDSLSFTVRPYHTWFYGTYTVVVYAGDRNLKNYLITTPYVQEPDGNFHEPVEIFQGDGIGVFASAIKDTVRFSISR